MRTISILTILCAVTLTACLIDTRKPAPAETISESCGNGILDPGEECDQGALNSDTGACLSSCRLATCGDGHIYPAFEQCDDGNRITEECEHGQESCTVCDARCQEMPGKAESCGNGILDLNEECDYGLQNSDTGACLTNCRLAECGDGHIYAAFEQCDDWNKITEECEYGVPSCMVCNDNCQEAPGETSFCGDGIIDTQEACDDGNQSCGICNRDCQGDAWRATGTIEAAAGGAFDPLLNETFTLNNGVEAVTFEFEVMDDESMRWTPAMRFSGPNVIITVSDDMTNHEVAKEIVESINNQSSLGISAKINEWSDWQVDLLQESTTPLDYEEILENVATDDFWTEGMYSGLGRDCEEGEVCSSSEDCEWGACCRFGVCLWCGG